MQQSNEASIRIASDDFSHVLNNHVQFTKENKILINLD
jgi:hypothetical protein